MFRFATRVTPNATSYAPVATMARRAGLRVRYVRASHCETSRICLDRGCRSRVGVSPRPTSCDRSTGGPSTTRRTPSKCVSSANGTICWRRFPVVEPHRVGVGEPSARPTTVRLSEFVAAPDPSRTHFRVTARWHADDVTVRSTVLSTLPLTGPRPTGSCPKGVMTCVHTS
jgi:hypothetical protein